MANWKNIHSNFTEGLRKKWKDKGFTYEETKNWADALKENFDPEVDLVFCAWLKSVKRLTAEELENSNTKQLRDEHFRDVFAKKDNVGSTSPTRLSHFKQQFSVSLPSIKEVQEITKKIIELYKDAERNAEKRPFIALMDRVQVVEGVVKTLVERKLEDEKVFQSQEFYKYFVKLNNILKQIKDFLSETSQLQGIRKFISASSIKDKVDSLTNELDSCIGDLNLTVTVASEEQRIIDRKTLEEDVEEISKFLEKLLGSFEYLGVLNDQAGLQNNWKDLKPIDRIIKQLVVIEEHITDLINQKHTRELEEQLQKNKQESENTYSTNQAFSNQPNLSQQSDRLIQQIKSLQEQINFLKQNQTSSSELEAQLVQKEQELAQLQVQNTELIKQCLLYLNIISQFKEKHKELNELKDAVKNGQGELVDKLLEVKGELTNLDNQLETIIKEQLTISKDPLIAELETKLKINNQEKATDKVEQQLTITLEQSLKAHELSGIKKLFLALRQETIKNLWKCYKLKYYLDYGKHAKVDALTEALESIGNTEILNTATTGISGAVGKLTTIGNTLWKKTSTKGCIKEFKRLLDEDSKNYYRLVSFKDKNNSPINKVKLFDTNYQVYEIINIAQEEYDLNFEQMKETIKSLVNNFKQLKIESKQGEDLNKQQTFQVQLPYGTPSSSK